MRQPEKIWRRKEDPDAAAVSRLSSAINVSTFIAKLLLLRGIDDFDKAKNYFCPTLESWKNPFDLPDMGIAVERVKKAIERQEKVFIFGDYDSDGVFSAAIVYDYLKTLFSDVFYCLPDRLGEGYGLSFQAVKLAAEKNCTLIIVLDNGTNAFEQISVAVQNGADVIVIDHHQPEEGAEFPPFYALVNPKRADCKDTFSDFCAGGLALKFVDALSGRKTKEIFERYSPWAAIATAADIVFMTEENRLLTHIGLQYLNENAGTGLSALIELCGMYKPLTVKTIVHQLVPKINAAGRVAKADTAFELLFAQTEEDAKILARELLKMNTDRKVHTRNVVEQVIENARLQNENPYGVVVAGKAWHVGVVGMAASRCAEAFCCPAVVLCESEGMFVGSVRSHAGIDLIEVLQACKEFLHKFGGHKFAAGVSLKMENFEQFKASFNEECKKQFGKEMPQSRIDIDVLIGLNELTPKALQVIRRFAPFGPENMRPVFEARKVRLRIRPTILNEKHLLLQLEQNGVFLEGTGFFMAGRIKEIGTAEFLDVCFVISGDEGEPGKRFLRLEIRDFRLHVAEK